LKSSEALHVSGTFDYNWLLATAARCEWFGGSVHPPSFYLVSCTRYLFEETFLQSYQTGRIDDGTLLQKAS